MHTDNEPGAHSEPRVPALLAVLVVRAAGPHAAVGDLRSADDQHLVRHRDPDAVGHGAEPTVGVAEPTAIHVKFDCFIAGAK